MTDGGITLITGILLIFSGTIFPKICARKKDSKRTPHFNLLYMLAGILLIILEITHVL